MRFSGLLALLALIALPAAATPAPQVAQAPEPAWVEVPPIPAVAPERLQDGSNGVFYLLRDVQIRWQGEQKQYYRRLVTEVTSRAGLEATATLTPDLQPPGETLTITRLNVIRNGVTTSWLGKLTPEIYRRETQLEAGIIDGTLTAHLELPDVQVGDIVDVGYLWQTDPQVPEEQRAGYVSLGFDVPVARSRVVIDWPKGWPEQFEAFQPQELSHSAEATPDGLREIWDRADLPVSPAEAGVPAWYHDRAGVRYSGIGSWQAIVDALSPSYDAIPPLPADWQAQVAAIRAAHPDDAGRAIAALRLVQHRIRYVGVEIGQGGYIARPSELVAARGWGDCKDKAWLLRTILADLGIPAQVALANPDRGQGYADAAPSLGLFNHMIVSAVVGGQRVWMDPTEDFQGGATLATAVTPDYGWVLRLGKGAPGRLEHIAVPAAQGYERSVQMHHDFGPAGDRIALIRLLSGRAADKARERWAASSLREMSDQLLKALADQYPGIVALTPAKMQDDPAANVVTVRESYLLSNAAIDANGLRDSFPFSGVSPDDLAPDGQTGPRLAPFAEPGNSSATLVITVEHAPIEFRAPDPVAIDNAAFSYRFDAHDGDGGFLWLSWTLSTKGNWIPAAAVAQVAKDARRGAALTQHSWNLTLRHAAPNSAAGDPSHHGGGDHDPGALSRP